MIIEFDGIAIEVTRKPIKNLSLRIYPPDGLVKISAPLKLSQRAIFETLEQKKSWIHQHRERIRSRNTHHEVPLQTGSTIPFLGKNYLLILKEHHGPNHIEIHDELMHCYTQPDSSPTQREAIVDHWYQQQMATLLPNLIKHWSHIINVKVNQWKIRKMKSRWGSCNTRDASINLNLNLMKKPKICLEYVLVHELIHLLEPSHNKRFYDLMSQFMPEWRNYEYLLKN